MNKESLVKQAEDIISTDREKVARRELIAYEARISFQTAVVLRNAMLQEREKKVRQMPGAFSYESIDNRQSNAEAKLNSVVTRFEHEVIGEYDEIVVPLLGSEIDELNTTLFPALRPHALVDSSALATLDGLVLVNEAYKAASGIERPSYIEGMKPHQS